MAASSTDAALSVDEVSDRHVTRSGTRWKVIVAALVLVPIVLVAGIPVLATVLYRSAVHGLHDELGGIEIASASLADEHVERCHLGIGPASVRHLTPVAGSDANTVLADYRAALLDLGFDTRQSPITRVRNDALDADMIELAVTDDGLAVEVIADVFDADGVFCPPF